MKKKEIFEFRLAKENMLNKQKLFVLFVWWGVLLTGVFFFLIEAREPRPATNFTKVPNFRKKYQNY